MTEAEWLAYDDPQVMLEFLRGRVSERKLRLFICACCHRVLANSPWEELEQAVGTVELLVDGRANPTGLDPAREAIEWGMSEMCESLNLRAEALYVAFDVKPVGTEEAADAANRMLEGWEMNVPDLDLASERLAQCDWLRDIVGNPLRPVSSDPVWSAWSEGTILKLAQAIYDERAFDRLPILADALEEAGCDNADILAHLRGPGPHVRGCWALDLILGRE